jgi:hypothetical protein
LPIYGDHLSTVDMAELNDVKTALDSELDVYSKGVLGAHTEVVPTPERRSAERKLLWKIDLLVLPPLMLMYLVGTWRCVLSRRGID